jgi:hypothetical protein
MTRRRVLKRQIRTLLTGLGESGADVASALRDARVSGVPQDPANCAIANYLTAVAGADQRLSSVTVGRSHVEARLEKTFGIRRPVVRVGLPYGIRQFMSAFDQRMYPELVRITRSAPVSAAPATSEAQPVGGAAH